jgi:hypothetical protein
MAKRKASRRARPSSGAAPRVRRQAPVRKARPAARKAAAKKRPSSSRPARSKAAPRGAAAKAVVRRPIRAAGKAGAPKPRPIAKAAASKARRTATPPSKAVAPKTAALKTAAPKTTRPQVVARKAVVPKTAKAAPPRVSRSKAASPALVVPARAAVADQGKRKRVLDLDRVRRRVEEDDVVSQTPPSSLGLDRTASAARSGRQELQERYDNHTETSPALTGGDVDADWESAYAVGDETPGGDNPTPDQNVVDDIAVAVGVEYDDNEELEGAERIEERDRHRWEFDPASSDDFDER